MALWRTQRILAKILQHESATLDMGCIVYPCDGALKMKICDNCGEEVEVKNEHVTGWCRGEVYYNCEKKEAN